MEPRSHHLWKYDGSIMQPLTNKWFNNSQPPKRHRCHWYKQKSVFHQLVSSAEIQNPPKSIFVCPFHSWWWYAWQLLSFWQNFFSPFTSFRTQEPMPPGPCFFLRTPLRLPLSRSQFLQINSPKTGAFPQNPLKCRNPPYFGERPFVHFVALSAAESPAVSCFQVSFRCWRRPHTLVALVQVTAIRASLGAVVGIKETTTPTTPQKKHPKLLSKKMSTDPWNRPQVPQIQIWKDFLRKQIVEGLGSVPRVCWNFLRFLLSSLPKQTSQPQPPYLPIFPAHFWWTKPQRIQQPRNGAVVCRLMMFVQIHMQTLWLQWHAHAYGLAVRRTTRPVPGKLFSWMYSLEFTPGTRLKVGLLGGFLSHLHRTGAPYSSQIDSWQSISLLVCEDIGEDTFRETDVHHQAWCKD